MATTAMTLGVGQATPHFPRTLAASMSSTGGKHELMGLRCWAAGLLDPPTKKPRCFDAGLATSNVFFKRMIDLILIVIVGWENTAIMISGWPLDGEGLNPWQGPTEGIFFALVSFVSSWTNYPVISHQSTVFAETSTFLGLFCPIKSSHEMW